MMLASSSSLAWSDVIRVLSLADYNTRVVVIGTVILGITSGLIGTFMLLRKRSLMGDAVSHATLPGIGIAFLVMTALGGSGKWLPGLLLGALVSGLIGMGLVLVIRAQSRLKEDAALGIVLSVFFGLGISLVVLIGQMERGSVAGLDSFIYGKTASMLASDAKLIAGVAVCTGLLCALFFKEFALLCFDQGFTGSLGWRPVLLDTLMMGLAVLVTVIGLQAVGLILVIALLITPAAAARFWTHRLRVMTLISAAIGGASSLVGACVSALYPKMPTGAVIVVSAGAFFLISMVFGTARGVLWRGLEHLRLRRDVERQHLLRALFEWNEEHSEDASAMPHAELLEERAWSTHQLKQVLARGRAADLVRVGPGGAVRLTDAGELAARRVVRNHRLWETYLITHADIAPIHVDRNADRIEHVLGEVMVESLEHLVLRDEDALPIPASPHTLRKAGRAR